jgi:hypothetical protein
MAAVLAGCVWRQHVRCSGMLTLMLLLAVCFMQAPSNLAAQRSAVSAAWLASAQPASTAEAAAAAAAH